MTRVRWPGLPPAVRRAVEEVLGAPVTDAVSQPGGFSPGSADRIGTVDGGRAFVKAVTPDINALSAELLRREAAVAAVLPASAGAPRMLAHLEVAGWTALVLEDVPGSPPPTPWRRADLDAVLAELARLAATPLPAGVALPGFPDEVGPDLLAWDGPAILGADLPPWARRHLAGLREAARSGVRAADGDRLVHSDVRADNVIIAPERGVRLVDWPWACRGAGWIDTVLLLVDVRRTRRGPGAPDADTDVDVATALAAAPTTAGVPAEAVTGLLAGVAGLFLSRSTAPPPPGLPRLREFQRRQGAAALEWVEERW